MKWCNDKDSDLFADLQQTGHFCPETMLCKLPLSALSPCVHYTKRESHTVCVILFCFVVSGKRGSNPRPSAWEADALPLSYFRIRGCLPPRLVNEDYLFIVINNSSLLYVFCMCFCISSIASTEVMSDR